jgi:hypothetical protein
VGRFFGSAGSRMPGRAVFNVGTTASKRSTPVVGLGNVRYLVDSMNFSIDAGSVIVPDTSGNRSATLDAGRVLFTGMITGTSEAGVTRVFDPARIGWTDPSCAICTTDRVKPLAQKRVRN